MARSEIPNNVRRLIAGHIDSVQQVEILALLRGDASRDWTPEAVCRSLHISPEACARWLDGFAAAGIVQVTTTGYAYAGHEDADELLDVYPRRRVAVIDAIYGKPDSA